MSIFNKTLTVDFGNGSDAPEIKLVQGEEAARVIHLKLSDGNTAVNLTGCTARIYILPCGETTPLYEDLTVITAVSGKCDYVVSGNAAAIAGAGKFWIEIIQTGSPDPLSVGYSKEGKLSVAAKQDFTGAIIASTVFSTLQSALATVATYLSRIVALETDILLKAPLASPTFTGSVTVPTPTTAMQAATKKYVDDNMSGVSGWALISEAWAYLSANSVTVPAGATSRFQKGDYIMLGQSTTKYFIVISVSSTTVSLTGGSDYVVDNAPISAAYLSRAVNPFGFPSGFNYAPVPTGFSSVPTGVTARFSVKGGICSLSVAQAVNGTSNSTSFTVPLPIQAANVSGAQWIAPAMIVDNSAVPTTPGLAVVNAASMSISLYKDYAGSNFTASGGKRLAAVFLQYAI